MNRMMIGGGRWLVGAVGLIALMAIPARVSSQAPRTVWDGVYSDAQAKRGETLYFDECARCHSDTLVGSEGGPPLTGNDFVMEWSGKTAADLFDKISSTMPADSPGRLSNQQATDILTVVLKANGFPAGPNALEYNLPALKVIRIQAKK
jgi:quinoprotein glucose dehydrogenase